MTAASYAARSRTAVAGVAKSRVGANVAGSTTMHSAPAWAAAASTCGPAAVQAKIQGAPESGRE